jgi:hypothetical protein
MVNRAWLISYQIMSNYVIAKYFPKYLNNDNKNISPSAFFHKPLETKATRKTSIPIYFLVLHNYTTTQFFLQSNVTGIMKGNNNNLDTNC